MDGAPFAPFLLVSKGKGRWRVPWRHSELRSYAVGGRNGLRSFRALVALQGVRRLAEAPGQATFALLSLLLPPPQPWARLPAVTRDSPPCSKAAAPGRRAPERPWPALLSRPGSALRRSARRHHPAATSSARPRLAGSAAVTERRARGRAECAVLRPPAPCRTSPQALAPHHSSPRQSPGWRAPRPGPAASALRALPPLPAPLPRPSPRVPPAPYISRPAEGAQSAAATTAAAATGLRSRRR